MDPSSFVHLDVRSFFSLKEGAFSPEELVRRAAELGMRAVGLTDRDGLYGAARFVAACRKHDVKPILGASLSVHADGGRVGGGRVSSERRGAPKGRPSSEDEGPTDLHVILLASDEAGYANLCRLITDAHMVGERGEP